MAISAKNGSRYLFVLSMIGYIACFALPDHWIRWSGPVSEDPSVSRSAGGADNYYFIPEMVSYFRHSWGQPLDWAGWLVHLTLLTGFLLFALGKSRSTVVLAVLALLFGLARHVTMSMSMGFLAGYYVWLAGMVVLGIAGGLHWIKRNDHESQQRFTALK